MIYELKNCRNGEKHPYKTTVEISEDNGILTFRFVAEHAEFFCPHHNYNDLHAEGDVCEVFIGSDKDRRFYYEVEVSPENKLMCGYLEYLGDDENNCPITKLEYIDCFVESEVRFEKDSYEAVIKFEKNKILTGDGEIYFNAFRIETDGGERDKHLLALSPTMKPRFHSPKHFVLLDNYLEESAL